MGVKFANNAVGYLASSISASDVGLVVEAGQGARFPVLGASEYFFATLVNPSGELEIVKVTARSFDAMTILRAQEGTTARSFVAGARVELRLTAQGLQNLVDGV